MKFYLKLYGCCSYTCLYSQTHTTHALSPSHSHVYTLMHTHSHIHSWPCAESETSDKAKVCYMCVTALFDTLDQLAL